MRKLFDQMVREMKGEKHLLPHSGEILHQQWLHNLSVIKTLDERIVAHVTLWPLYEDWFEFGTIWVPNDYRGQGLSKALFVEILQKRPRIMLTTTNPIVFHLAEEFGMRQVNFDELPPGMREATCICPPEKIKGCSNQLRCPLKDKECRAYLQGR